MKKIYVILAAAVAALMALSCEKSAEEFVKEPASSPISRTFTCVFAPQDNIDSKVDINLSTGKATWEEGDEIMIHGGTDGASRKLVTLTAGDISADGKTATFTVEGLAPYTRTDAGVVSEYYAQYPASAVPSGNLYYECRFNNTDNLLMAACNVGDKFEFYNLSGVISYKVSGDFDEVTFSGNNGEAVGYDVYQVRVRDDGSGSYCNYWKTGNGSGTPVPMAAVSKALVADGVTDNFIYLPNGATFNGGFTFYFKKGGVITHYATSSKKVVIEHGQIFPIGLIPAGKIHEYVAPEPPSSHEATNPAIDGAEDLGATATANSYIVDSSVPANAGKVFKFKAVKGNSTTPVGDIGSVVVLWETWNNNETVTANSIIASVDYDKKDGDDDYWITLEMASPLHAGNAVIAAKNVGGDILWSWHIWVPSSSVDVVDASNICGATLMDRNLGALEPVSTSTGASVYSLGMYYQWGRKDPFLGPKRAEKDAGYALVAGTSPSVLSGSTMSISESIKNPTKYAASGISDMDLTKWSKTKTMYDPCPPGYKLPYMSRNDKPLSSTSNLTTALDAASLGWEASTTGFWFKAADGAKEVVFPLAGYVEEGVTSYYTYKITLRGAIWYLCDSGSSPYHLNIRPAESTPLYQFGSTNLSRGCNVRCCVE